MYAYLVSEHLIILIPGDIKRYNFLEAPLYLKIKLEALFFFF